MDWAPTRVETKKDMELVDFNGLIFICSTNKENLKKHQLPYDSQSHMKQTMFNSMAYGQQQQQQPQHGQQQQHTVKKSKDSTKPEALFVPKEKQLPGFSNFLMITNSLQNSSGNSERTPQMNMIPNKQSSYLPPNTNPTTSPSAHSNPSYASNQRMNSPAKKPSNSNSKSSPVVIDLIEKEREKERKVPKTTTPKEDIRMVKQSKDKVSSNYYQDPHRQPQTPQRAPEPLAPRPQVAHSFVRDSSKGRRCVRHVQIAQFIQSKKLIRPIGSYQRREIQTLPPPTPPSQSQRLMNYGPPSYSGPFPTNSSFRSTPSIQNRYPPDPVPNKNQMSLPMWQGQHSQHSQHSHASYGYQMTPDTSKRSSSQRKPPY